MTMGAHGLHQQAQTPQGCFSGAILGTGVEHGLFDSQRSAQRRQFSERTSAAAVPAAAADILGSSGWRGSVGEPAPGYA